MSLSLQSSQMKKEEKFNRETTVQLFPVLLVVYAQVTRLATDHVESSSNKKNKSSFANEDKSNAIKRIEKILELAKHERTSESEAKHALRISAKMLSSANSKESRVILYESKKEQAQRGGHSIVTIRRKDGRGIEKRQWTSNIAHAIARAFNVKHSYKYQPQKFFKIVFYGLRDNTDAAAMSFEAVFNLSLTWAANRQSKNCYSLGLSSSIKKMTKAEQKAEENQAIENEKHAFEQSKMEYTKKWRAQDVFNNTKATTVTDQDDDEIIFLGIKRAQTTKDTHKDVKVEVKLEKDEKPSINKKRLDYEDEENEFVGWQSYTQLMEFRKMAEQIAEDYFKENFGESGPRLVPEKCDVHDRLTYRIGQKDARNVDLKRRRLET